MLHLGLAYYGNENGGQRLFCRQTVVCPPNLRQVDQFMRVNFIRFLVFGLLTVFLLAACRSQAAPAPTLPAASADAEAESSSLVADTPPMATETPPASPATPSTPEPTATPTAVVAATPVTCALTPPDQLGPFYVPDAPVRDSVGTGHLLRGTVRSGADCTPLPNARIEIWQVGPDGEYADDYRATLFADETGAYTFTGPFPPPYANRPSHLHLRISADGFETLVTQYYPAEGQTEGQFDLVLPPSQGAADEPVTIAQSGDLPGSDLFDVPWPDRSIFAAGLIESERRVLEQLPGATVYHIDLTIAEDLLDLQGREVVLYTNREETPLDEIYFRLFPNVADGSTTVSNLTVNNQTVEPSYELNNSAMRVPLASPLAPGEPVVIGLDFSVRVPDGEGGNYGTFANLEGVLALAHFYPMIAVYDDEGWNVEIAPAIGDVVYADSSFYLVRVSAPAAQTLIASGSELERAQRDDRQTVTYAAGPVRDFYLVTSDRFAGVSRQVGQTTVNSYAPVEFQAGVEAALTQAAQALESFNTRFGAYPFTEFDLVSTTTFALGVEYPGVVAILLDLYDPADPMGSPSFSLMESVVAHEVAHQWFYSQVGNDQVDEPWLDEALAQYLTLLYYVDVYGPQGAASFEQSLGRRWDRVNRADIPIGEPVRHYTAEEYSAIVYGRGPLFISHLAETMGQETFNAFLRDYYQSHLWGIATGAEFKQLAEQHCACDLTEVFETWVY